MSGVLGCLSDFFAGFAALGNDFLNLGEITVMGFSEVRLPTAFSNRVGCGF